uniref:RanBP2-type domain-containing protein n=1 Tax=Timema genevievae TaxID=629358 RepID=A0A7R9PPZ7_TIMGE|nr:unnamed protein product [Timema genevievae]
MDSVGAVESSCCRCSNIAIMQLFHELKQKFPAVPDRVVSQCIKKNSHNKETCEVILSHENQTYLLHSYPTVLKMAGEPQISPLSLHGLSLGHCDQECTHCSQQTCESVTSSHATECERVSVSLERNSANPQTLPDMTLRDGRPSSDLTGQALTRSLPQFSQMPFQHQLLNLGNIKSILDLDSLAHIPHYSEDSLNLFQQEDGRIPHSFIFQPDSSVNPQLFQLMKSSLIESHTNSSNDMFSTSDNNSSDLASQGSVTRRVSQENTTISEAPSRSSVSLVSSTSSAVYHKHSNRPSSLNLRPNCHGPKNIASQVSNTGHGHHPLGDSLLDQRELSSSSHSKEILVDNIQVNVSCSLQRSPGGSTANVGSETSTAPEVQKIKSTIQVQPAPHYSSHDYWNKEKSKVVNPECCIQQPRSYTSVNLTLRPPSSEPQPPIDIHSAGTSLTYSTSSYDPQQGFQSQLQIRIGPGRSGSVSAVRTRSSDNMARQYPRLPPCHISQRRALRKTRQPHRMSPYLSKLLRWEGNSSKFTHKITGTEENNGPPDFNVVENRNIRKVLSLVSALLAQQLERRNKLRRELQREKLKLHRMQREKNSMQRDLEHRELIKRKTSSLAFPIVTTVLRWSHGLRHYSRSILAADDGEIEGRSPTGALKKVQHLRQEIQWLQDECKKMTTEVDLTSSDSRVPLGETDEEFYKNIYTGQRCRIMPARSHMAYHPRRPFPRGSPPEEGPNWTCSKCTFRNHPLLDKCEECNMPRILLGTASPGDFPIISPCYCHPKGTHPLTRMALNGTKD